MRLKVLTEMAQSQAAALVDAAHQHSAGTESGNLVRIELSVEEVARTIFLLSALVRGAFPLTITDVNRADADQVDAW